MHFAKCYLALSMPHETGPWPFLRMFEVVGMYQRLHTATFFLGEKENLGTR